MSTNPVVPLIAAGPQALADALACDLSALTPAELVEATRVAQSVRRHADALVTALLAEGSRQDAHQASGEVSMTALVAREAGVSRHEAAQQVRLAQQLQSAPLVRESLSLPGMSTDKARIVTNALASLPSQLTAAERTKVEADLAAAAQILPVEQLRRKVKRAVEVVDVERADQIENAALVRSEHEQARQTTFWISQPDPETGMVKGGFEVDTLTGDILRSFLDSATAPRKQKEPATAADRPRIQGEAFAHLVRHLPRDGFGNHGGVPATLVVTATEATLRGQTDRAGVTEHGSTVSAGQLRKLACDAGILPAVMDGASATLDLGREKRFHSPAQRQAIAQRDQGCAFPGCDRPPSWCETHHIRAWSAGEPTTVDDGTLLCSRHHHEVHDRGWELRLNRSEHAVEFRRHPHLPWERNARYRPLQLI